MSVPYQSYITIRLYVRWKNVNLEEPDVSNSFIDIYIVWQDTEIQPFCTLPVECLVCELSRSISKDPVRRGVIDASFKSVKLNQYSNKNVLHIVTDGFLFAAS